MSWSQSASASLVPAVQIQPLTGINTPAAPTLAVGGSGSSIPTGTAHVVVTFVYQTVDCGVTYTQETPASPEATIATTAGQTLTVTVPTFPAGAVAANIYAADVASGVYNLFYQAQEGTSGGSVTLNGIVSSGSTKSPATTNFPNGNLYAPSGSTATGGQILYAAPSQTSAETGRAATAIIKEIIATNTDTTAGATDWVSLYIVPSGSVANAANAYQFYELPINAMDSKCLSGLNKGMPAGSTIQSVQQNAGKITLDISVVEVQ